MGMFSGSYTMDKGFVFFEREEAADVGPLRALVAPFFLLAR
jgi:hypothetical protein